MSSSSVRVWDIFTRLFHWLLVVAIGVAWWSGEQGGEWMSWHLRAGYLVLGLVIFRVIWGFAGSHYARFGQFLRSPASTLGYLKNMLKGRDDAHLGHNPAGGWGVIVLLLLCAVQAGTGLFANDDIFTEGPLAYLVGYDLSIEITRWHKLMFNALLAMIALHVLAVVYHQRFRKEAIVQAMITGKKPVAGELAGVTVNRSREWLLGSTAVLISAAAVWGLISL